MACDSNQKPVRIIRVKDREPDQAKNRKPHKIECVGGCEFHMYEYRDEFDGAYRINLPNFEEAPEYTDEGRPFCLTVQESCEYGRYDNDPDAPDPGDCGGCAYFYREKTAYNVIGVCMCKARRRETKEE